MFATSFQGYAFLLCAVAGVVIGLVYEAFFLVRFCFKHNTIATILCDVAFSAVAGGIALWCFYNFLLDFRLYIFLGFIVGFTIERFSIGFLIAKTANFVYNVVIKIKRKILASRLNGFFKRVFR